MAQNLAFYACLWRASIGSNVTLGQNVFVEIELYWCYVIQNNVSVYDNVTLGRCICGPSMVFQMCNPRSIERKSEYRDTVVGQGATLGANCTIIWK